MLRALHGNKRGNADVKKRIWIPAALVFLALGAQTSSSLTGDPMAAVRDRAQEFGYAQDDLDVLSGSYSSGMLSIRAEGLFRSRSRPELGEIRIAVERPLPFASWRLVGHSCEGGDVIGR
jgi:hypothetical protein